MRTPVRIALLCLFVAPLAAIAQDEQPPQPPPAPAGSTFPHRPPGLHMQDAAERLRRLQASHGLNKPNIPPTAPIAPAPRPMEQTIAPRVPSAPAGPVGPKDDNNHKSCEEIRKSKTFQVFFSPAVELEKLVQTVADATCKTFIVSENVVRGKISIVGPDTGRSAVTADEFYTAFLAALDANDLNVVPIGRFLRIIPKANAKSAETPIFTDPNEATPSTDQIITKMVRLKYAEADAAKGVLAQLQSKGGGEVLSVPPDMLILVDTGGNVHRMEKVLDQIDRRSPADEIRVIQVRYAAAQDVANTIQKIFESKTKPGQRAASPGVVQQPWQNPNGGVSPPAPGVRMGEGNTTGESTGGPVTLSQILPDERTNKLIVMASATAFIRIEEIINQIDVPISGEGRINVYYLENANAEEMASTLQSLAQGSANKPKTTAPGAMGAAAARSPGSPVQAAELFQGEVKISADKSTNALVIVASQNDYRNLVKVIEKLDMPRRQVFVDAVILEINLNRETDWGLTLHNIFDVPAGGGNDLPVFVGTKYSSQGVPPSIDITNLLSLSGLLAGIQGPPVSAALQKIGINLPSFGVLLHALQTSSDVNILSTPHLLTSDNEEAEITVGQNVPFQAGFSPTSLSSSLGAAGTAATSGLSTAAIGGFGSLIAPIQRQNVDLKLTIKPTINDSDYVRLVINEQTEEIASTDPVLGPTTSKRAAKTTVIAHNQETVVIGGIMQEHDFSSASKLPILGDLPIIGHLFRDEQKKKVKTNLLLFLTPYIIKDQSDFRQIFERKMRERQEFVEQFYGQVPGYDEQVDFSRKAGPLGKINQIVMHEEQRAENGGPGLPGERIITPKGVMVIDSPGRVRSTSVPVSNDNPSAPAPIVAPPLYEGAPSESGSTPAPAPVPTPPRPD